MECRTNFQPRVTTTFGPTIKDDPAQAFFKLFPTPEEIHGATDRNTLEHVNDRIGSAFERLGLSFPKHVQETNDPDFAYIFNHIAEVVMQEPGVAMACVQNDMAFIALQNSRKGEVEGQGTNKDQLLAYYLWRLRGSKDETSPLRSPASIKTAASADVPSLDFLPSSMVTSLARGSCANCGNTQARSWCSGCRIVKSDRVVFATFYCDRGCMKAHWRAHKPACKEARIVRRAATVFAELWLENLKVTHGGSIASLAEDDGLIEVEVNALDRRAHLSRPYKPFPQHMFKSEEQMLACLAAGNCFNVIQDGMMLLWSLLGTTPALVESMSFRSKNAHKTVVFSYPDDKSEVQSMPFHTILRLTLPSGLRFAFDPTGSQNGWQEILAPWDAYEENRIHFIEKTKTINGHCLDDPMAKTQRGRMLMNALLFAVKDCVGIEISDGGLKELFHKFPDDRFEATRESLVKAYQELLKSARTGFDKVPAEKS